VGVHVRPVGELSGPTYWRRRALLAVPLVLVLLVLARSCGGNGGPSGTLVSSPDVSSPGAVVPPLPASGPPSAVRSTMPSAAASRRPSATAAAVRTCPDSALQVTVRSAAASNPVGTPPQFRLGIRNTSAAPCRRDVGPAAVELVVTSGADRVWSSDDCSSGGGRGPVVLPPGAAQGLVLSWSGTRSRRGCKGARERALPGTYRVSARVGGVRSASDTFQIG